MGSAAASPHPVAHLGMTNDQALMAREGPMNKARKDPAVTGELTRAGRGYEVGVGTWVISWSLENWSLVIPAALPLNLRDMI